MRKQRGVSQIIYVPLRALFVPVNQNNFSDSAGDEQSVCSGRAYDTCSDNSNSGYSVSGATARRSESFHERHPTEKFASSPP
jgi:hypothetical protein